MKINISRSINNEKNCEWREAMQPAAETAKRWKRIKVYGFLSSGFSSPSLSAGHYCYERHPLDTFCVIHKFPLEMFQVLLSRTPLVPFLSLRQFPPSSPSPKLVVLMMVIPQQYRSINVVKYIVGSKERRKKMEK